MQSSALIVCFFQVATTVVSSPPKSHQHPDHHLQGGEPPQPSGHHHHVHSAAAAVKEGVGGVAVSLRRRRQLRRGVRSVRQWIEVARQCCNLGNFNSLMAVITGLNMAPVTRLAKTVRLRRIKDKKKSIMNMITIEKIYLFFSGRPFALRSSPCLSTRWTPRPTSPRTALR